MVAPLSGFRIIEFAGIGPGPHCGQLLADFGAEVILIDRPTPSAIQIEHSVERRGKKSVVLDLKTPEGVAAALTLVATSDALIEGNRPGVMERLGLGPQECLARNPALVYGRMTGWGQTGPYAHMAGHDINYIGLTGALHAIGPAGSCPPPPLNTIGDFGGGSLYLTVGILTALLEVQNTGQGRVIDAAITDGVTSNMGFIYSQHAAGRWRVEREANLLDGQRPYYRTYRTSDDKFLAVGCIEPHFHAEMLRILGMSTDEYGPQNDHEYFPVQHALLTRVFSGRTQAQWSAIFDGTDACVTPVLRYNEVGTHPHMAARNAIVENDGLSHPNIAPKMGEAALTTDIPKYGQDSAVVLRQAGYSETDIAKLAKLGVLRQA